MSTSTNSGQPKLARSDHVVLLSLPNGHFLPLVSNPRLPDEPSLCQNHDLQTLFVTTIFTKQTGTPSNTWHSGMVQNDWFFKPLAPISPRQTGKSLFGSGTHGSAGWNRCPQPPIAWPLASLLGCSWLQGTHVSTDNRA
jgi:hypothetical protein